MGWVYKQSTGSLDLDGSYVDTGYSGNGTGLNNPAAQDQVGIGPIPQGNYVIGAAMVPPDQLGPLALSLTPDPANQMFGRFGFFIHGDAPALNHTASDGCIILAHATRQQIDASADKALTVVA